MIKIFTLLFINISFVFSQVIDSSLIYQEIDSSLIYQETDSLKFKKMFLMTLYNLINVLKYHIIH